MVEFVEQSQTSPKYPEVLITSGVVGSPAPPLEGA